MGRPNRRSQSNQSQRPSRKAHTTPPKQGYGEMVPLEGPTFKFKTQRQKTFALSIRSKDMTVGTGPAGTGKTYVALAEGAQMLKTGAIKRLICTKPVQEIDEKLGTLPGDETDKIAVSMRPIEDTLNKILGASHVENLRHSGKIVFLPLGSILGTTFDDSFVFMDEAQNSTPAQMKVFLLRTGQRSKVVICGDYLDQCFIRGTSGLEDALFRLRHLPTVGHVDFSTDDIVRSGFCREVILAYRNGPPEDSIQE